MYWFKEVSRAPSRDAVCELMNEYLASISQRVRAVLRLPEHVEDADDVAVLHRELADAASATQDEDLHEVAVVFMRAAARLVEIDTREDDAPGGSSNGSAFRMLGGKERFR